MTVVLSVGLSSTLRGGRSVALPLHLSRLTLTKPMSRIEVSWRSRASRTWRPRRLAQYLGKVESPAKIAARLLREIHSSIVDLDQLVIVVTFKLLRKCRLDCRSCCRERTNRVARHTVDVTGRKIQFCPGLVDGVPRRTELEDVAIIRLEIRVAAGYLGYRIGLPHHVVVDTNVWRIDQRPVELCQRRHLMVLIDGSQKLKLETGIQCRP